MSRFTKSCRENTRKLVTHYLGLDDIDSLCFSLYIDTDNLKGETLDQRARSLIIYFEHQNDVETLVNELKLLRPSVSWCEEYIADDYARISQDLTELTSKGKLAVSNLGALNKIMAESRLLELEITMNMFGALITPEQRLRMQIHIDELSQLISTNKS